MTDIPSRLDRLADAHLPRLLEMMTRWREQLGRVRLDRAARRLGLEPTIEDLDNALCHGDANTMIATLNSVQRDALLHLDREWPAPGRRTTALADRLLGETGLAFRAEDALIAHPIGLLRLIAALDDASNAAFVCRSVAQTQRAAAAAIGLDRFVAEPGDDAASLPPAVRRLHVERALRAIASEGAVSRLAGTIRATIIAALDADHALPPMAIDWLIEPPHNELTWRSVLPAPLCLDDASLVELVLGPNEYDVSADALVGAIAAAADASGSDGVAALLGDVPLVRPQHCRLTLLPLDDHLAPLSADEARARLVERAGAASADLRAALLELAPETGESPTWAEVARLASAPGLLDEIEALLEEDTDWLDFDAPGEGRLPDLWLGAIVMAGPATASEAARRLASKLPAATLVRLEHGVANALSSLRAVGEGEVRAVRAGYVHGLNDAIAEAYGDVFAPTDPFSTRRPARR